MSFLALGVPADLVDILEQNGISEPFEIQQATIPDALAGRDVLGRAPTGSGKTLAFGLPLLSTIDKAKPRKPTALILSPTRELAEQIRRDLSPFAKSRKRSVLAVYGGVGFGNQLKGLRDGADIVVATPGRLIDLLNQKELTLDEVRSVVVDEADRMADMGFLPVVKQILDLTSSDRQTLLFSATLGPEVKVLTDRYQHDPVTHTVGDIEPDLSQMTHRFIKVNGDNKLATTAHIVGLAGPTIVFCRTRHGSDRLARQLANAGIKTSVIHGNRSQNQRDAALKSFTEGKVDALVATDVAARGIHVDGVACVVHYDPPAEKADYVHRSGRTARAGASGEVVSMINKSQEKSAKSVQKAMGLVFGLEDPPDVDIEAFQAASRKRSLQRASHTKSKGRPKSKSGGQTKQRRNSQKTKSKTTDKPSQSNNRSQRTSAASDDERSESTTSRRRTSNQRSVGRPSPGKKRKSRASDSSGSESDNQGKRSKKKKATTRKTAKKRTSPSRAPAGKAKSKRTGKPRPKNKKSVAKKQGASNRSRKSRR